VATASNHNVSYTYAEYLAHEAASNVKHEYYQGHIFAMAGGTPDHAALQAAAIALLFAQLRSGSCRAHTSDQRIRVLATGLATYPDVTIVCGRREQDPDDRNTLVNPSLLIEVTNKSSNDYDRGEKFENYKRIPSLKEYVIVSHAERAVAELASVGARLDVKELYDAAAEPT
jgi:Uma2 family endonuclease